MPSRLGLWLAAVLVLGAVTFLLVGALARPPADSPEPASPPSSPAATPRSFLQDGFQVEMDVRSLRTDTDPDAPLRAWDNLELRFTVREEGENGAPLSGLTPLSWLVRRDEGEPIPDREQCKREIRALLAGRLARAADVNLNEYYLITLDENNSISVIDPQIESAKTKTLGMVSFPSYGSDFALAPDRRDVLVTLPDVGQVAASDVNRMKSRYLDLGGEPWTIDLQPDGHYAWVGHRKTPQLDVIGIEGFEKAATIEVGAGPHRLAFRSDSRAVYVVSPASPRLDIIDVDRLQRAAAVPIGPGAIDVAYSALSRQVYVLLESGQVAVIDGDDPAQRAMIPVPESPTAFALSPDGRYGFVLYRDRDELVLFDTATQRTTHTVKTESAPDALGFTDTFAYLRHAESDLMLMIDLTALAQESKVATSAVSLGQSPPTRGRGDVPAPMLAPLPEGGGALILSTSDLSIYHFMEGMNAPMGAYRTYPYRARGLLIVDRTIREIQPGVYATDFQAPDPGTYTVPFLLPASPQLYGCLSLELEGLPTKPDLWKSLKIDIGNTPKTVRAGERTTLQVILRDPASGAVIPDLSDVVVLIFRGPRWQWKGVAHSVGEGRYEWEVRLPEPGAYRVMLKCRSRGLEIGQLPAFHVHAETALEENPDGTGPPADTIK